jgi:perosamine synthetase
VSDVRTVGFTEELAALEEVLRVGVLSGESPIVEAYEEALSSFFGTRFAIATSSGTGAIHSALIAVGVERGSEVLVPALAPLPTVLPVLTVGAIPVPVDVHKDHLGFDLASLTRRITPRTRAALCVALWGYPLDLIPSIEVLERHGVPLIEDACQAHGATAGGRLIGTIGKIGCFSTNQQKLLSTGEGGFVLTDDPGAAEQVRRFSRLGRLDGHHHGTNYLLSALPAALGRCRLRSLPETLRCKRENARAFLAAMTSQHLEHLRAAALGEPNFYSLVLKADLPQASAGALTAQLLQHGLPSDKQRFGFDVLYRRPMFASLRAPCPNAERLVDTALQIPCHSGTCVARMEDLAAVVSELADAAASVPRDRRWVL